MVATVTIRCGDLKGMTVSWESREMTDSSEEKAMTICPETGLRIIREPIISMVAPVTMNYEVESGTLRHPGGRIAEEISTRVE